MKKFELLQSFEQFVLLHDEFLLATSLVVLCCAIVVLTVQASWQRIALRNNAKRHDLEIMTMIREVASIEKRCEGRLQKVIQRIDQLQLTQAGGQGGYAHAQTLARTGASTDQLTQQCGLTRGEAELLRRLHPVASNG